MTTRRLLLIGGVAWTLAAKARASGPEIFEWRHPGRDPLSRSLPDEEALRRLSSGLVPTEVEVQLLQKMRQGRFVWDEIPVLQEGFRFTRMLFGQKGTVVPNVLALTAEWPESAIRKVRRYEIQGDRGFDYVLIRPEVCGNWSLRVVTTQGVCVVDTSLCSPECLELRKHQA